jgi:hypothetical protein
MGPRRTDPQLLDTEEVNFRLGPQASSNSTAPDQKTIKTFRRETLAAR